MRYLIDTDWVIHHLNGRLDIIQRLQALQPEGLGLSVIVLAELYEGVYYARDPGQSEQRLNDFLESVALVGVDEETAKIFGRERGRLRAAGMMIGDMDLLIAATALQYDLTLLTNNRHHFERIEGLRIESCSLARD
jgi:tRNA(fMet)-specific endonuclease VapC